MESGANVIFEKIAGSDGFIEPEDFSKAVAQLAKANVLKKNEIQDMVLALKGPKAHEISQRDLKKSQLGGAATIAKLRMTQPMSHSIESEHDAGGCRETRTESWSFPKGMVVGAPVQRCVRKIIHHGEGASAWKQQFEELAEGVVNEVRGVLEETVVFFDWQKAATGDKCLADVTRTHYECAVSGVRTGVKLKHLMPTSVWYLPMWTKPYNVFQNCPEVKLSAEQDLFKLLSLINKKAHVFVITDIGWDTAGGTVTLLDTTSQPALKDEFQDHKFENNDEGNEVIEPYMYEETNPFQISVKASDKVASLIEQLREDEDSEIEEGMKVQVFDHDGLLLPPKKKLSDLNILI